MRKNLPMAVGLLFVILSVGVIEVVAMIKTGGRFCYPLDDTFIHMALAKNIALYGNWGITRDAFASASSSPLFTAALALLFKLFSVNLVAPLLISFIGTVGAITAMGVELRRRTSLSPLQQTVCILVVLLIGSIPALTLLGMEHTLQIAFTLFFVGAVVTILQGAPSKIALIPVLVWGALMSATRYENAFVIGAAVVLFACKANYRAAALTALAGVLPISLFGLYSIAQGGLPIPNSVLLKGSSNTAKILSGSVPFLQATTTISGLIVIAAIVITSRLTAKRFDRHFWALSIFLIAGILHTVMAAFGWFFRYEAYLIVLGGFYLTQMALEWWGRNGFEGAKLKVVPLALVCIACYSLPMRGAASLWNSPRAIYNIYEQQYQMGLFLSQHYQGQAIAANDIGAISYMADVATVDLVGLGNNDVARARRDGRSTPEYLQALLLEKNVGVVVAYESWLDRELTDKWERVAFWELPFNYICGDIRVHFYGVTPADAALLKIRLHAFASQLPADVRVKYF